MLQRLAHYSIRVSDLATSKRFYTEVLGLEVGARPPFGFPGAWLYLADEDVAGQGVVHLIHAGSGEALDTYLGGRPNTEGRTCALDHIAFFASDWPGFEQKLKGADVRFVERFVPLLGVRQVFLTDPDGVVIELNFAEPARS